MRIKKTNFKRMRPAVAQQQCRGDAGGEVQCHTPANSLRPSRQYCTARLLPLGTPSRDPDSNYSQHNHHIHRHWHAWSDLGSLAISSFELNGSGSDHDYGPNAYMCDCEDSPDVGPVHVHAPNEVRQLCNRPSNVYLLHIIRNERQPHTRVGHVVRRATSHLPGLQVAGARGSVRRSVVNHCAASLILREAELVVVVISALIHAVREAGAGRVRRRRRWTALVAEEVLDVETDKVKVRVDATRGAVRKRLSRRRRRQYGERGSVVLRAGVCAGE